MDLRQDESAAYIGSELEIFAYARNWKRYFARRLQPYISGDVLEVGAGIGNATSAFCTGEESSWLCLEPDAELAAEIDTKIASGALPSICRSRVGSLRELAATPGFDTILYIDVLEHIEDDAEELAGAARLLMPGGHLIVLAPAWQWLYSPFDSAVGHFRRYTRGGLRALTPPGLSVESSSYLDVAGLLASGVNRIVLKSRMPTVAQIVFWDRFLVPVSRLCDPLIGHRLGKSVAVIWTKSK